MLQYVSKISHSPSYILLTIIVVFVTIYLFFFKGIKWVTDFYLAKWPFVLKLPKQNYFNEFVKQKFLFKTIIIKGFRNLFPSNITLTIKVRKRKIFEQINIKFQEKRWFKKSKLWRWIDTPKDIILIKEIIDVNIQNSLIQYNQTHISDINKINPPKYNFKILPNDNGGCGIYYSLPYECPKGDSLLLEIKLDIKVKTKWKGRINFKHIRGDNHQTCADLPVKIIHKDIN